MSELRLRSAALQAQNQALLLDFLRADLDLAFTFLATAAIDTSADQGQARALLAKARTALGSIRLLTGRIEDRTAWREIHWRANELEAALESVTFPFDSRNSGIRPGSGLSSPFELVQWILAIVNI